MDNVKVSLSITLPGGVMFSPQECGQNPKLLDKQVVFVPVKNKKTKKIVREAVVYFVRKCKNAFKTQHLTKEAFDYMTSLDSCPYDPIQHPRGVAWWKKISPKERLEFHLSGIMADAGGVGFSYQVLED